MGPSALCVLHGLVQTQLHLGAGHAAGASSVPLDRQMALQDFMRSWPEVPCGVGVTSGDSSV